MKPIESLSSAMQSAIPHNVMEELKLKLDGVEAALLKQDPNMKDHLRESHRLLISYPETVHLLDDTEIASLLRAAQEHMKMKIVSDVAKGKGSSGRGKKPSVEDL